MAMIRLESRTVTRTTTPRCANKHPHYPDLHHRHDHEHA